MTTLRSATSSATSSGDSGSASTGTFANSAARYFGGLRFVAPSLTSEGVALSKAHSRFQLTLVHDDAWRFTTVASDGSMTRINKPNRFVAEGDFDFLEAKKNDQSNVIVGVHLRWDTPAASNGGASDLRIAVLAAVNIFDF